MNNVEEFINIQQTIQNIPELLNLTQEMVSNTKIYSENFISKKEPLKESLKIEITEESTFQAARRVYDGKSNITALNFANPLRPGGGVLNGANAQEECLCRMSNLYKSLESDMAKEYYSTNNEIQRLSKNKVAVLSSDAIVFSPKVVVFKKENYVDNKCFLEYAEDWFKLNILTCAAPYFAFQSNLLYYGLDKYRELLKTRIQNP